jgi:hypothetical protein
MPRRESSLTKRFCPVVIATTLAAYAATPTAAPARWLDPATAGYCVSGTCSKFGGRRAVNIKNCRPENCRDFVATNVKATAAMPQNQETSLPANALALDLGLAASGLRGASEITRA